MEEAGTALSMSCLLCIQVVQDRYTSGLRGEYSMNRVVLC